MSYEIYLRIALGLLFLYLLVRPLRAIMDRQFVAPAGDVFKRDENPPRFWFETSFYAFNVLTVLALLVLVPVPGEGVSGRLIAALAAVYLGLETVHALVTGKTGWRESNFARKERPLLYWSVVASCAFLAALMTVRALTPDA